MNGSRPTIVVLGMLTRMPVGGMVCLTMPYLVGLERLGYDVYYLEQHGANPSTFMQEDDGSRRASAFLDRVFRRFGLAGRWGFQALHSDGAYYGLGEREVKQLLRSAAVVINLHGGTLPGPDHLESARLVLLDTDPGWFQVKYAEGDETVRTLARQHGAFFTWAQNLGRPGCGLPVPEGLSMLPTRMPVLLDLWSFDGVPPGEAFTTVGNWEQFNEDVVLGGEAYRWSKHHEFLKLIELPRLTSRPFELALSSYSPATRAMLEDNGWRVRHGLHVSGTLDAYRRYLAGSRGEFTVAKDQNIRLRTGWFSDRSAAYLAAGRPVITQDTGFGDVLPTGEGLFAFSGLDDILAAVEAIDADYGRHSRAAREIATEYFDSRRVLARLLESLGLPAASRARPPDAAEPEAFASDLDLEPVSRRPTVLSGPTVERVLTAPLPWTLPALSHRPVEVTIVVPVHDHLVLTRLCLESVLANTGLEHEYELVVVDNGSAAPTAEYLDALAAANGPVKLIRNDENLGFAAAVNQGLEAAEGIEVVLLNNDTIVPRGWLEPLRAHLRDPAVGLVGALSNRGRESRTPSSYRTYGELLAHAGRLPGGPLEDVPSLAMFCTALRRAVLATVGPLDERFGIGLFEDDDYALRVRTAGYRVVVAPDAFVHHFGHSTIADPAVVPDYGELFRENRRRFEEKWQSGWTQPATRPDRENDLLAERVRDLVSRSVPPDAGVIVVSKGDDALLQLGGRPAWHFPSANGLYSGRHPADSEEAIAELETLKEQENCEYLLVPQPSFWWLDHYGELRRHLDDRYRRTTFDEDVCVIYALREP